ncbi:hypothetical protein DAT35_14815 [Vitiosangium sp. GDMCC 1.1324]|nr:hypothetical protein DAT35_14815 [Vitiosangium sp. GDMCC 1.1324]
MVLATGAALSACATLSAKREPNAFKAWPSRPPDCDFDVFEEDFEPSRPYEVLGTLPFNGNQWIGEKGRKELLRETACKAGAQAVLLSRPYERRMGKENIRTYDVRFVVYTDVPPPPEIQAAREAAGKPPPPPRPASGTVVIPSSEWTEDAEGTSVTRQQ